MKELQNFLGLSNVQSVYSWFQGKALPSLDNFYALSCYLGIRIEELVVASGGICSMTKEERTQALLRRQTAYFGYSLEAESYFGRQECSA